MIKKLLKIFFWVILTLVVCCLSIFRWMDPSEKMDKELLDSSLSIINSLNVPAPKDESISLGWSRNNIIPPTPRRMVGYGYRAPFESIHDSLFVRSLVFKQKNVEVAVISFDLMIVPPILAREVEHKLEEIGIKNVYFSASHSHSSFGGYSSNLLEEITFGKQNPEAINELATSAVDVVQAARKNIAPLTGTIFSKQEVKQCTNRLTKKRDQSEYLRKIQFVTKKGTCNIFSFNAHPTIAPSGTTALSNDYPGVLCSSTTDFSIFLSGTMGSISANIKGRSFENVNEFGNWILSSPVTQTDTLSGFSHFYYERINLPDLPLGVGISETISVRNWVFNALINVPPNYIDVFRIQNLLFIGLPCELSAEYYPQLEKLAKEKGVNLVLTSFNGTYLGYTVPSQHYHINFMETREMNWTGKYGGDYFNTLVETVIQKQ